MAIDFDEAAVREQAADLSRALGESRLRFHRRLTPFASSQGLIDLDREIRETMLRPLDAGSEAELRELAARLRQLDPR